MVGWVEGEVPGAAVVEIPAGAWRVGLEAAGAEQDADAFGAEGFDAAAEGRAAGQRGVDEGQDHDRHVEAGGLGEDAEGVGVADAQGPFVDRVVGGRGDDDGVGYRGAGVPGLAYWLRTGWPVACSMAAGSKKPRAAGVAMTWTVQPRSRASWTKVPMAVAGPAPHTMTDRTRW